MNEKQTPNEAPARPAVLSTDLLGELGAEAKLMRAASRFAIAFDENKSWGDQFKRLDYTLNAWKELAMAAVEFAAVHSPNAGSEGSQEAQKP